jgi:hypothetical protein
MCICIYMYIYPLIPLYHPLIISTCNTPLLQHWPVLIICPSSVRKHWEQQLITWLCPDSLNPNDIIIMLNDKTAIMRFHKFVIVSYSYFNAHSAGTEATTDGTMGGSNKLSNIP